MPTHTLKFYDNRPIDNFINNGATVVYNGPVEQVGTAIITDNETGIEGETLDDDNGGGETATADVTIGGNTSIGSPVDAEMTWLARDTVTGEEFTVAEFQVETGAAAGSYTLSERPLVPGRTYQILESSTVANVLVGDPAITYSEYVCIASGSMIQTPQGETPIERLCAGDQVMTLDHGPRALIWTGSRSLTLPRTPQSQIPIELKANCCGTGLPSQDLILSPQHQILSAGKAVASHTNQPQALSRAKALTMRKGVRRMEGKRSVVYHSLLFECHEIIFANGLAVESFYPGPYALSLLSELEKLQILAKIPHLSDDTEQTYGTPARPELTPQKARSLAKDMTFIGWSETARTPVNLWG